MDILLKEMVEMLRLLYDDIAIMDKTLQESIAKSLEGQVQIKSTIKAA